MPGNWWGHTQTKLHVVQDSYTKLWDSHDSNSILFSFYSIMKMLWSGSELIVPGYTHIKNYYFFSTEDIIRHQWIIMQKFCVICFGIHFRKAVREEENSPAYQGGNRGIHFGGLEEGCYHQESLVSVGEKTFGHCGKEKKQNDWRKNKNKEVRKLAVQ